MIFKIFINHYTSHPFPLTSEFVIPKEIADGSKELFMVGVPHKTGFLAQC